MVAAALTVIQAYPAACRTDGAAAADARRHS